MHSCKYGYSIVLSSIHSFFNNEPKKRVDAKLLQIKKQKTRQGNSDIQRLSLNFLIYSEYEGEKHKFQE